MTTSERIIKLETALDILINTYHDIAVDEQENGDDLPVLSLEIDRVVNIIATLRGIDVPGTPDPTRYRRLELANP